MTSSNKSVIELSDINKVFYTDEMETYALSGVSLEVKQNDFVSISGPSGCGKSTLLSILGLLDLPSSGSYKLQGSEVTALNHDQRSEIRNQQIGFIFQAFNLIGDISIQKNVELPLTYRKGLSAKERAERVEWALDKVAMSHRKNHLPSQLSGGQQQRVAVARALVGQPAVLLADEPTGNLDSKNGDAVMELLAELHQQGSTICMVTHDSRYLDFAQNKFNLFDGKVV